MFAELPIHFAGSHTHFYSWLERGLVNMQVVACAGNARKLDHDVELLIS